MKILEKNRFNKDNHERLAKEIQEIKMERKSRPREISIAKPASDVLLYIKTESCKACRVAIATAT
jgi:hypothetical protein